MTEQIMLTCVLNILKDLMKLGHTAMIEAPTVALRSLFANAATEHGHCQFAIFAYLEKHGLYPVEAAPKPKIKQTLNLCLVD